MAVTTNKVVRLTFTTTGGKTFAITIPDPREDLDKAEVEAVMDTIIQKNVLQAYRILNDAARSIGMRSKLAWILPVFRNCSTTLHRLSPLKRLKQKTI